MRYQPLQIFKFSKTPAGLYARQKWLGESETPAWRKDFAETVAALMEGQGADGSWMQSPFETIRRLFALHLTLRNRTEAVDKALEWLVNAISPDDPLAIDVDDLPPEALRDLPFVPAFPPLTLVCAVLFLACVFGREGDEPVEASYRALVHWLEDHAENSDLWADKSNALRTLIVHPVYAQDSATLRLVDDLEANQKPSGLWPAPIPFFLTLNALAHLNLAAADRQWLAAVPLLSASQKKDGAWGSEAREWNTFLVVHALKNKKYL